MAGVVRRLRSFPVEQERRGSPQRAPWIKAIGRKSWDDILDGEPYVIDLTAVVEAEEDVDRFAKAARTAAHTRGHGLRVHVAGFRVTLQAVLNERAAS